MSSIRVTLYDSHGNSVPIGAEVGRGGEGVVYSLPSRPGYVAKIYHKPVTAERAEKLTAMVALATSRILGLTAWPVATLHDSPKRTIVGFAMPAISTFKPIHTLYGPKTRLQEFPDATWPFLIHTAANTARAFAAIHDHGHVIGDVNHDNIKVSDKATVALIDCDSFQIERNGITYPCEVGVPTHQPPEFQGIRSFHSVHRTGNHDNFGLAVIIFQLLFMGRHPFAGAPTGLNDIPIEDAIANCIFPYGSTGLSGGLRQPPGTMQLSDVSQPVADLFERAFSREGMKEGRRPKPGEWLVALDGLSRRLKGCANNAAHVFAIDSVSCPWCLIESQSRTILFNIVASVVAGSGGSFSVSLVWAQIAAVPEPGPAPKLPDWRAIPAQPDTQLSRRGDRRRKRVGISVVVVLAVSLAGIPVIGAAAFLLLLIGAGVAAILDYSEYGELSSGADRAHRDAQSKWQALGRRWTEETPGTLFQTKLSELERAKQEYDGLDLKRQRLLQQLSVTRRDREFQRFLDRQRLAHASVSGVGPARKATLQSYGVETAADIDYYRILRIPGFGPSLAGNLVAWRRAVEGRFRFDPGRGVDPADVATVERDIRADRSRLEQILVAGPGELRRIGEQITARRQDLAAAGEGAARELATAAANVKAVRAFR